MIDTHAIRLVKKVTHSSGVILRSRRRRRISVFPSFINAEMLHFAQHDMLLVLRYEFGLRDTSDHQDQSPRLEIARKRTPLPPKIARIKANKYQ